MRVWGCTFHLIFWGHRTVSVQEHKTGQKEGLRGADRKERGIKWIKEAETARRGDATQCRTKNEIHSPFFTAFSDSINSCPKNPKWLNQPTPKYIYPLLLSGWILAWVLSWEKGSHSRRGEEEGSILSFNGPWSEKRPPFWGRVPFRRHKSIHPTRANPKAWFANT